MDKKAKIALKKSIAHWRRLEASVKDGSQMSALEEGWGVSSCALCHIYFVYGCVGCPVRESTGQDGCRNTPYSKAAASLYLWSRTDLKQTERKRRLAYFAAQKMRSFLERLSNCVEPRDD